MRPTPVYKTFNTYYHIKHSINGIPELSLTMNKNQKNIPIGLDVKKIIAFRFGIYRYQAEHFDHNEKSETPPNPNLLILGDDPMKRGTKIYRFIDFPEYNRQIAIEIRFYEFLEEEDIKKGILDESLRFQVWDPEEFKEHFLKSEYDLPYPKREHVDHGYPECQYPFDKCPVCDGELDDSVLESENAEDVFNSYSGSGPDGKWSRWEEIHRCPHCGKRFFIEEET